MKRLRTVSLAITVALALTSCIGIASAGAAPSAFTATNTETKAPEYPVTINGKALGTHVFGFGVVTANWTSAFGGPLPYTSDVLSPELSSENAKLNGCNFTFHAEAEVGSGSADIGGASCTGITVTGSGAIKCVASILPQTLPVKYKNSGTTPQTVEFRIQTSGVEYLGEGGGAGCPKTIKTDGELFAAWSVSGKSEEGSAVNMQVSPAAGLHLEGGQFLAESYPAWIYGDQTTQHTFAAASEGPIESCGSVHFSGSLTGASSTLAASAVYAGCSSLGNKATVAMHSCQYVYHAGGTMDIACSKEGDSIEVQTYLSSGKPKCTTLIGPQEGLTTVSFTNFGTGSGRSVEVAVEAEGVTSTALQGILYCGVSKGVHTEGIYTGSARLYGVG